MNFSLIFKEPSTFKSIKPTIRKIRASVPKTRNLNCTIKLFKQYTKNGKLKDDGIPVTDCKAEGLKECYSVNGKNVAYDRSANGYRLLTDVGNNETKKDDFGNTNPFYCFGYVDYITSTGEKPMNIEWEVEMPIMAKFLEVV